MSARNRIARVKPGQHVIATLDAYLDWQIPSHVRTVATADREKGTVKVRVSFDHLDPRILPDMGVKVAFLSDESHHRRTAAGERRFASARNPWRLFRSPAVHGSAGQQGGNFSFATGSSSAAPSGWSVTRSHDIEVLAGCSRRSCGGPRAG